MPTTPQIENASGTLSDLAKAQWLTLIRGSTRYRDQTSLYLSLESKLASVSEIQAKQLNAALALIDEIGDGTVSLAGGGDGVDYSQERDREDLINYGISALYDQPISRPNVGIVQRGIAVRCPRCYPYTCSCGYWLL